MPRPFLTASWHHLAMLNYRVEPALLAPHVPRGTTLDSHNGATWVSLVGFLFADTRVLGLRIPYHTTFPELNLRFYVRRTLGSEVRRGVVFIKEIVPRPAIASSPGSPTTSRTRRAAWDTTSRRAPRRTRSTSATPGRRGWAGGDT